jgi:hypothetical protein
MRRSDVLTVVAVFVTDAAHGHVNASDHRSREHPPDPEAMIGSASQCTW